MSLYSLIVLMCHQETTHTLTRVHIVLFFTLFMYVT